eukprot:748788-Hanusia_phi.AAC.3
MHNNLPTIQRAEQEQEQQEQHRRARRRARKLRKNPRKKQGFTRDRGTSQAEDIDPSQLYILRRLTFNHVEPSG